MWSMRKAKYFKLLVPIVYTFWKPLPPEDLRVPPDLYLQTLTFFIRFIYIKSNKNCGYKYKIVDSIDCVN